MQGQGQHGQHPSAAVHHMSRHMQEQVFFLSIENKNELFCKCIKKKFFDWKPGER